MTTAKVNKRYRVVKQDQRITFRLPASVLKRIDELRYEYGQTRSEFVRGLLISYFRETMRVEEERPRVRITPRPGL